MGNKSKGSALSETFRGVAGLPPRENDGPTDPAVASEIHTASEPEGGYGGEDGITNVSSINASEHPGGTLNEPEPEPEPEQEVQ